MSGIRLIDANKFEIVALQGKSEEFIDGVQWVLEQIDSAETVLTIPEQPTNGSVLQAMFPKWKITVLKDRVQVISEDFSFRNEYSLDWWNAPYKENTDA